MARKAKEVREESGQEVAQDFHQESGTQNGEEGGA